MPWQRIETETKSTFTRTDREEIFYCTLAYSASMSFAGAAATKEIEILRSKLVDVATDAVEICKRYTPPKPDAPNEQDETILLGLTYNSADGFHLPEALRLFGSASEQLLKGLSKMPETPVPRSRRDPNIEALENFIMHVLGGAETFPARNKDEGSFERWRWGIRVGPSTIVFAKFVNAVLRAEFSRNQVRDAVREVLANDVH